MAIPTKLTIVWDNHRFDAAVLTASSARAGFPAAMLQDPVRSRTWRTNTLLDESLTVDFGESVYCSCLGLINHNFSLNIDEHDAYQAKVRVQASDDPDFGVLLKDHPYDVWADIIGAGEGGAGEHGAGGVFLESERAYYAPDPISLNYFEPAAGADHVCARYWRLLFEDPANPDGYFEVGRIFLCLYDEYAKKPGYGWGFQIQDDSEIVRSTGGVPWKDRRATYRMLRLPWKTFANEDKYWRLVFFIRKVGTTQEFIIDAFPDAGPSERYWNLVYALLASPLPEITADEKNYSGVELTIVESL